MTLVHRVRVEDPGHHARVGADVRRRDVLLRADLVDDLAREAAGHALELAPRKLLRIADDAALRAAERQAHERALPRHPHRERLDLVAGDVRVVADAALRRAARDVVRDAVALEDGHRAVVHRDGDRDLDGLLAPLEDVDQVRVDRERLADASQLLARDRVRILAQVGWHLGRRHAPPPGWLARWRAGVYASDGVSGSGSRRPRPRRGRPAGERRRAACRAPRASVPPRGPRPVSPNAYRPGRTSRSRASRPSRSPPRQSSTSSRETGRSWRRPARSRTWPACTVRTAGARSDARKLRGREADAADQRRALDRQRHRPRDVDPAAAGDLEPRPPFDRAEPARQERDARGQRHEALLARPQPQPGRLRRHRDAGDSPPPLPPRRPRPVAWRRSGPRSGAPLASPARRRRRSRPRPGPR